MSLQRSKDRKVTNKVSPNGKTATIANAFGLPSGKPFSCPGATSVCERICYAGKIEKMYTGVRNVMLSNWEQLKDADQQTMQRLIADMILEFITESNRKGAPLKFRIHWDGDFFSLDYARAWANVIKFTPEVQYWVYTRSFTDVLNVIPIIADIPNLTVYLSVDNDNVSFAGPIRRKHPSVKWAWLANTFAEGREDMPVVDKRYDCPENAKRIPLISEKGSACVRCGICVDGRGDVIFSIKKK